MPITEQDSQDTLAPNPTIWDRSAAGRWFARIFSFELLMISTLLILPLMISLTFTSAKSFLHDPDIWWHLANARHLFTSGFIHTEPYSFTVAGKPWINPEWGAEVPYWLGYSNWGLQGLFVVAVIAGCLNILGIYLLARIRTGHMWSAFTAAFLGTPLLFLNFGTRTILWGYICLIIEFAILELWSKGHRRLLWLLPPLFCLWINVHSSWAMGFFLFVLFAVSRHISFSLGDFYSERLPLAQLRQLWIAAAASFALLFINPYGWKLVWYPVKYAMRLKLSVAIVQEWQPLQLTTFDGKVVVLIVVLFLLANGIRRRRWDIFELFLVTFGVYAAVEHSRFACLLAIFVTPSLAYEFNRLWLHGKNPDQKRPLLNIAFLIAFWIFGISRLPSTANLQAAYAKSFPTQLVSEIQPDWRVMNSIEIGGFLALNNKPEFIDTRYDIFDYNGVLRPFLSAMYIHNTLSILKKFNIDHVLFEKNSSMTYFLLHTTGWKEIGEQNGFVLFARDEK